MSEKNRPCPRCRANRWKTVKKGMVWQCRGCAGYRCTADGKAWLLKNRSVQEVAALS